MALIKYLAILLVILLSFSAGLLYKEYQTVDRWQKKASGDDCPAWVKQSPLVIALGLWIEMFRNLVTLIVSICTACFMWMLYRRESEPVIEIMEERE